MTNVFQTGNLNLKSPYVRLKIVFNLVVAENYSRTPVYRLDRFNNTIITKDNTNKATLTP